MNEYKTDVMKRYKSLTKKEQGAFYNKMKEGSESARQKLIDSCLPLVIDMAKKFSITNKHVELEDLVQEGNVALVRAVDSWDANKGSITTIATYYIKSSLVNMIQDCNYHIQYSRQLTRSAIKQLNQIKKSNSTDPAVISEETGIPEKTVVRLLSFSRENRLRRARRHVAGHHNRANDYIDNVSEQKVEANSKPCFQDILELSKKVLTKTEQKLLFDRYGINGRPLTLKRLSEKFNETIQNVDKTLTAIQAKLREASQEGDDAEVLH